MQNPGAILVFTYTGDASAAAAGNTARSTTDAPTATATAAGIPASFTADQAARGSVAYLSNCSTCHGQNLVSATYGTPLAGPYFETKWSGKSVGALFQYTHDRMPPSRPGSLSAETYADIVAHILAVNGATPGDAELPADTAALAGMTIGRSGG